MVMNLKKFSYYKKICLANKRQAINHNKYRDSISPSSRSELSDYAVRSTLHVPFEN